ncbi:hypothetical protein [Candidatus Absconditicoccus praedator]|uniref:hypothetical protein n=1 Tax=Candidatus Absconditicoccus praedator TaxID=2735562 RepID=UPI001E2CB9DC|nr:hypothetical protein [Candidatus Absconditicoccus praedator]UFX82641.1 hypothetical protein HLG78_00615 [Candidatus Absconditicoccus praedator]
MAFLDENGFVCGKSIFDEIVEFSINSQKFKCKNNSLIIYYRQNLKEKDIKLVSDKMTVFRVLDRQPFFYDIPNILFFLYGVNIFQEFDENTGKLYSVLFGYDVDTQQEVNDVLEVLGSDVFFHPSGKYMINNDINFSFEDIKKDVYECIEYNDVEKVFSFLLGLGLFYGNFDTQENDNGGFQINNFKLHLPLSLNLIGGEEFFSDIGNFLKNNGIFVKQDFLKTDMSYVYQLSTSDYEVLESFKNYLKDIVNIDFNPKKYFVETIKEEILSGFEFEDFDKEKLDCGTLKYFVK